MFRYMIIFGYALVGIYCIFVKPRIKFSPEVTKVVRNVSSQCYVETNADPDVFNVIESGGYKTNEKFKKLIHCIYDKLGYINDDGTPKVDLDVAALPNEYSYLAETLRKCVTKQENAIESIYQYFKCYQDMAPATMDFCFDSYDPNINYCKQKIVLDPDVQQLLRTNVNQCLKETGINPDVVIYTEKGGYYTDDLYKSYINCIFKKSGLSESDGSIQINKVISLLPEKFKDLSSVLNDCNKPVEGNEAEKTFQFFICFLQKSNVLFSVCYQDGNNKCL